MNKKIIPASEIPRVLRIFRNMRGLSQAQLALRLGVDTSTLAKYETGAIQLTHQKIEDIAKELNIEVYDILTFTEDTILGKNDGLNTGQKLDPKLEEELIAKNNEIKMLNKMVVLMEEKENKDLKKGFQQFLLNETQIDSEKFDDMMKKVKQNNYKVPVTLKKSFFQVLESISNLMKK